MTHTSVTWLSAVIRCWTVCPSMVVICWMYAPSSCYRHTWVDLQLCIKQPLERIRCSVQNIPDLMVPELQWCVLVPEPAASLEWALSGVPAGLWDTHDSAVEEFCKVFLVLCSWCLFRVHLKSNSATTVMSSFLTLQRGEGLLVTVNYDGLLRRGSGILPSQIFLIVEALHVKFQMPISIKSEVSETKP